MTPLSDALAPSAEEPSGLCRREARRGRDHERAAKPADPAALREVLAARTA